SVVQYSIAFVGRTTSMESESAPHVTSRLQHLVDWRLSELEGRGPSARAELKEFGWWFANAAFDERWRILTLRRASALSGIVEPDDAVMEALVGFAPRYPSAVVDIIGNLVSSEMQPWHPFS